MYREKSPDMAGHVPTGSSVTTGEVGYVYDLGVTESGEEYVSTRSAVRYTQLETLPARSQTPNAWTSLEGSLEYHFLDEGEKRHLPSSDTFADRLRGPYVSYPTRAVYKLNAPQSRAQVAAKSART
jgi:hypothetical protein